MKASVMITVPVHRCSFTEDERWSMNRLLQLCPKEDICFIAPQSITYIDAYPNIPIVHFENTYFCSIPAYNRLMLSADFYQRFITYDYVLIYQLDAFLFRNEIAHWCQKGYSYVGAPWLLKAKYRTPLGKLLLYWRSIPYRLAHKPFRPLLLGDKVGNGGLSLRKTADCLQVCLTQQEEIQYFLQQSQTYSEFNEDCFWATRPQWTYPSAQEGIHFSVDYNSQEGIRQLHHTLPMGCHGWSKPHASAFWRPIIEKVLYHQPLQVYFDYQAFVHQSFGGVSRIFVELIKHLPSYAIAPHIGILQSNNIHLQTVCPTLSPSLHTTHRTKNINRHHCLQELCHQHFDIIHATYFDPYILSARRDVPLIITIHDMIDERMGEGHRIPTRKALLAHQAQHIVAVSEHTKKDIMDILHIPSEKISVVYHACSLTPNEPKCPPHLPTHYLLYVGGRKRHYKCWSLFMQAAARIIAQHPIDIVCVGETFTKDETSLIHQLGLSSWVHQLTAADDQLYTIYHQAQCFVFPSIYEGFGLPILEAFTAHCPTVLSHSSCFPEIAGDAALYFAPNDVDDLTHRIEQLLTDPLLRQTLITRGLERVSHFNWEQSAQQLSHIYHQVYEQHIHA